MSFRETHKVIQAYISGLCDVVTASSVELAVQRALYCRF